jgi:hypothetical protein
VLYSLMRSTEGSDTEDQVCIFTDPAILTRFVVENPPADGQAYSILEYLENQPGIARRTAIALIPEPEEIDEVAVHMVTANPISSAANVDLLVPGTMPFDVRFDRSTDGKTMLRLFETAPGILDAQYDPACLTESARTVVRELTRVFVESQWRQS